MLCRIEDVLYKDDEANRPTRNEFIKEKVSFIDSKSNYSSILLAKYNLVSSEEQQQKGIEENRIDWLRLEAKFQLSLVKEELPMCLIVPGYNNNAKFRIEANLNSVFMQNYSNYRLVLIDDASTDGSGEVYRNYFRFHAIDKQRYTYIENARRATVLENIYFASMNPWSPSTQTMNSSAATCCRSSTGPTKPRKQESSTPTSTSFGSPKY